MNLFAAAILGPANVHIETFGCTANVGDTLRMRAIMKTAGHKIVEAREADIVIVNTCTVTKRTELNVLKRIKELKVQGKEVVVAGCMAAAQPELVKSILGEDVTMITPRDIYNGYSEEQEHELDFDGVIAVIPIAMGCVGRCTYCIVKQARGDLRSYAPDKLCKAVKSAVDRGAKEIRITAQDCSAYGWDGFGINYPKLPELLELLTAVEGDFRIRVGMMNPFTVIRILDELLDAFETEKIFNFFHVPVQSGSDKVLGDMRRNYKAADFDEIVKTIRKRFKYSTICTDFIVGFPSETEEDFDSSLNLLKTVKPEKVNITRFSPRPATEASKQKDLVEREKKIRSRIFSDVYHRLAFAKNNELVGKELPVLVTEMGKKGGVIGRDISYRTIVIKSDLPLGGTCEVRVKEAKSTYLVGEV
uniref:tRNA-t(6)A37 methylthiotransferase n=1 Tax=Candidatus Methanophagaceae archaeon ANME-1 ERB6 TaxID=2759912 RepID=A0A7G9YXD0_9EURY|nr:tRNA-2-methylthio-N(6)-dimethylallyladenosine synthase [Methanosarcinales archaeon ANME-1 ERB6]QNO52664.1 tRNA-2-methylthio-N(6)-dimethylallyladenosine synthase [Methanosarcinales archaeon ANME-1 ERB6]